MAKTKRKVAGRVPKGLSKTVAKRKKAVATKRAPSVPRKKKNESYQSYHDRLSDLAYEARREGDTTYALRLEAKAGALANEHKSVREKPRVRGARGPGTYPWYQCVEDQMERGYSEEAARRICGAIRSKSRKNYPAYWAARERKGNPMEINPADCNLDQQQLDTLQYVIGSYESYLQGAAGEGVDHATMKKVWKEGRKSLPASLLWRYIKKMKVEDDQYEIDSGTDPSYLRPFTAIRYERVASASAMDKWAGVRKKSAKKRNPTSPSLAQLKKKGLVRVSGDTVTVTDRGLAEMRSNPSSAEGAAIGALAGSWAGGPIGAGVGAYLGSRLAKPVTVGTGVAVDTYRRRQAKKAAQANPRHPGNDPTRITTVDLGRVAKNLPSDPSPDEVARALDADPGIRHQILRDGIANKQIGTSAFGLTSDQNRVAAIIEEMLFDEHEVPGWEGEYMDDWAYFRPIGTVAELRRRGLFKRKGAKKKATKKAAKKKARKRNPKRTVASFLKNL